MKGCVEDMILDDNISPPTGFSNQNMLREVVLTWDGKSESIEFMAGVVRDQPAHPRRDEFKNILEYYRSVGVRSTSRSNLLVTFS